MSSLAQSENLIWGKRKKIGHILKLYKALGPVPATV
jgi:hypothetical protein